MVTEEASNTREFVSTEEEQQCFQMYKNWLYDYAPLHYSYQCLRKNVPESDILPAITEKVWQFFPWLLDYEVNEFEIDDRHGIVKYVMDNYTYYGDLLCHHTSGKNVFRTRYLVDREVRDHEYNEIPTKWYAARLHGIYDRIQKFRSTLFELDREGDQQDECTDLISETKILNHDQTLTIENYLVKNFKDIQNGIFVDRGLEKILNNIEEKYNTTAQSVQWWIEESRTTHRKWRVQASSAS